MTAKLAFYMAVLSNNAFCARNWGIYIFQIGQDRVNAALCLKILSISLQSLNARNYLRWLHKPCHSVRRLKNEHCMHNSWVKIFNALPVATVLSSNGLLITSLLRQLELHDWFISANKITTKITAEASSPAASTRVKHSHRWDGICILQTV